MRWTILAAIAMAATAPVAAEPIDVKLGQPLARFDKLKPGVRTYVRYTVAADGVAKPVDMQVKTISFEGSGNQRRIRITQSWVGAAHSIALDSLAEDRTLRPLTHRRVTRRGEEVRNEGFRFDGSTIVGDPALAENTRKDFSEPAQVPPFNFEIDLETLSTLPLKKGAEFRIHFYHPGGGPPAPYLFKVAAEEELMFGGKPIDCWVVTTDYNQPGAAPARFWVAKDSQIVLRVHSPNPKGGAMIKALTAAP